MGEYQQLMVQNQQLEHRLYQASLKAQGLESENRALKMELAESQELMQVATGQIRDLQGKLDDQSHELKQRPMGSVNLVLQTELENTQNQLQESFRSNQ